MTRVNLAFTRPKAGRKVGPLNWTQEHKDGPALKATGNARKPARDWPVPKSASVHSLALMAHANFLKIGHFVPFSQFLHIKGLNIPDVLLSVHVYLWPLRTMKFHGNRSARFW